VIRLLIDRYDGLVSLGTQATCRLHAVLLELIAGRAPRPLSASRAAKLLRSVHPAGPVAISPRRAMPTPSTRNGGQPSDHRRRGRRALPPRVHEQRLRRHPASGRGRLHPAGRDAARPAAVGRGRARGAGLPARTPAAPPRGDPYLADPAGKIALIERGLCRFDNKIAWAQLNGAVGAIVHDNPAGGEALQLMGGDIPVLQGAPSIIATAVTIWASSSSAAPVPLTRFGAGSRAPSSCRWRR
jgi:hypothetical protein